QPPRLDGLRTARASRGRRAPSARVRTRGRGARRVPRPDPHLPPAPAGGSRPPRTGDLRHGGGDRGRVEPVLSRPRSPATARVVGGHGGRGTGLPPRGAAPHGLSRNGARGDGARAPATGRRPPRPARRAGAPVVRSDSGDGRSSSARRAPRP